MLSNSFFPGTNISSFDQKEGARRGLYLNYDKYQHLPLNSTNRNLFDPAYLLSPVDDSPVSISDAVKHLGIYLDPRSTNHKNVSTRASRAKEASKKLGPLMKHGQLPPNWRLLVYRSIVQSILMYVVQSILMYAVDSIILTPAQLIKLTIESSIPQPLHVPINI